LNQVEEKNMFVGNDQHNKRLAFHLCVTKYIYIYICVCVCVCTVLQQLSHIFQHRAEPFIQFMLISILSTRKTAEKPPVCWYYGDRFSHALMSRCHPTALVERVCGGRGVLCVFLLCVCVCVCVLSTSQNPFCPF